MTTNRTLIEGAHDIVAKMKALQNVEIPEHLMKPGAKKTRRDFDPNIYFTVLTHLTMLPGYTLDYVYAYFEDFSGNPCLYARPVADTPLKSPRDHEDWEKKHRILNFLVTDGTPQSFFELVIFRYMAGQFYLFWHANYNDTQILTSQSDITALISQETRPAMDEENEESSDSNFTREQMLAMRAVDLQPSVYMTDDSVIVSCCIFTKWGGLFQLLPSFQRAAPHDLGWGSSPFNRVEYNCGMCY